MQRALALDNSPPLYVTLPFFLNVPLFLMAGGLLALWQGPDLFVSGWTPGVLALTHVLTLGVLASAMMAGMLQILPVATGIRAVQSTKVAPLVYGMHTLGTVLLSLGFLTQNRWYFTWAMVTLGAGFGSLLMSLALGMWRHRRTAFPAAADVLGTTRWALAALCVAVVAGISLAGNHAQWWGRPEGLHEVHVAWGLAGWLGLLVAGMSYQLIPIFQATELYPAWMTRRLAAGATCALSLILARVFVPGWPAFLSRAAYAMLAVTYTLFAATTLNLLRHRKRPQPDITTRFWLLAMMCLLAAVSAWIAQSAGLPVPPLLIGVLVLFGFGVSAVNGMLYKIIPFLLWFNLQRHLDHALPGVPKVKELLPEHTGNSQWWCHASATLLLCMATVWPYKAAYLAAPALLASGLTLAVNSAGALYRFYRARVRIGARTALAAQANRNMC
jgi:hypothetical protein